MEEGIENNGKDNSHLIAVVKNAVAARSQKQIVMIIGGIIESESRSQDRERSSRMIGTPRTSQERGGREGKNSNHARTSSFSSDGNNGSAKRDQGRDNRSSRVAAKHQRSYSRTIKQSKSQKLDNRYMGPS